MGIAIGLTRKPKSILVLDIDERLINFDNKIFNELGLKNYKAEVFDLRNPLPPEFINKFDTFVSDPSESLMALKAFVGRGIASLKEKGGTGYFGLTLIEASIYKWKEFQKLLLNDFGVVITDILQDFNHYVNWEYHQETLAAKIAPVKKQPKNIWYTSAWIRIEALPGFKGFNEPVNEKDFVDFETSTKNIEIE